MPTDEAKILHELEESYILGHNDEVTFVAKKRFIDAIKVRGGQWITDTYGWLFARSHNIFEGDEKNPRQYEKIIDGGCHNDDYPKDNEAFEWRIMGHYNGERGDMSTKRNCFFRVTEDYIEFYGKKVAFNDLKGENLRQAVINMYQALLGRPPESEAVIETWIAGSGQNLDIIRQGIMGSPEYKRRHGIV